MIPYNSFFKYFIDDDKLSVGFLEMIHIKSNSLLHLELILG